MSSQTKTEPFPLISSPQNNNMNGKAGPAAAATRQRRRKSSSLGADPRGDTGANAITTSHLKQNTPPYSPTSVRTSYLANSTCNANILIKPPTNSPFNLANAAANARKS